MPKFEYRTEVLTSVIGRDKLRVDELDDLLRKHGDDLFDGPTTTRPDGHLLVFKRPKT